MKTILCYGDSLTWGASPVENGPRHAFEDRWPTTLEAGLGGKARCIAEGLGGRTTVHDDWYTAADRNGARILPTLLASHWPLDMVVVMLGTNDIKHMLGRTALEASYGIARVVDVIRAYATTENAAPPEIIVVAPPVALAATAHPEMTLHFGMGGITETADFAKWYKLRADEQGVGFFDAGAVATTSPLDGIHLDAANTRAIGTGLVPLVKQVLGL